MNSLPPSTVPPTEPAAASSRQRLWDLPESAHVLLLGLSLSPAALRTHVARALSQHHRVNVELQGSDTDLLFATVHDLGSRNALSEALERRLDALHAAACQRFARLRDAEALRSAWQQALKAGETAAALWALLTHRHGGPLRDEVLMQARTWAVERARVGNAAGRERLALLAELTELRAHEQAAQRRHLAHQQASEAALQQLREALAAAQGEARRWQALAEARTAPAARPASSLPALRPGPATPRAARDSGPAQPPAAAASPVRPAADPPDVQGRRVLCVGGVQRAVSRYRSRVEQLGGEFEHHDGGAEAGTRRLDACLQRADLVLCQAGCINHEAYHRIKRHCLERGTPCIFLARPSLAHLERALAQGQRSRAA